MSFLVNLADVRPVRLSRACEAAVIIHPGTAAAPAALPPERLPALRRRVADAQADLRRLESLALALTAREVRGLITGLEQWEDLRSAVRLLLSRRLRASLLAPLWRSWQRFPLIPEVRWILVETVERFGWQNVIPSDLAGPARQWIASEQPGIAIQAWLDSKRRSYSALLEPNGPPFLPDTPLLRLVRDAVLMYGSADQLRFEGSAWLLQWSEELNPYAKLLFGRNYLVRIGTHEWYRPILDWIEKTYGLPKKPKLPSFWAALPEEVQHAFQTIFIREKLRKALGHDTEREAYWQRWEDYIHDVEDGTARDVPYSVFDFGGFGVIEFFVTGNAAYIYTPAELTMLTRGWARSPNDLKIRRDDVAFTPGQDNRIIHSGSWQFKASLKVRAWLRHTGK